MLGLSVRSLFVFIDSFLLLVLFSVLFVFLKIKNWFRRIGKFPLVRAIDERMHVDLWDSLL